MDPSTFELRAPAALAAIELAYAEEKRGKSSRRAELWGLALNLTIDAFHELHDNADVWGKLQPTTPPSTMSTSDAIAALEEVQRLLAGNLVLLLNHVGYRPPPAASDLVHDLNRMVFEAVRGGEHSVTVEDAKRGVKVLLARLEGLRAKSDREIRKELSPLRRRLQRLVAGVASVVLIPAGTAAAQEMTKTFVRYEMSHVMHIDTAHAGQSPTGPVSPAPAGGGPADIPANLGSPSRASPAAPRSPVAD